MPAPGTKPVLPDQTVQHQSPFAHAATASAAAQGLGGQSLAHVREEDVMQRVYHYEPKHNVALYYVGIIFLFFGGLNFADAWRLDSLGTLSRPLLPAGDRPAPSAQEVEKNRRGAAYIVAGTAGLCALLAYLPTRQISTITIIPRFPRPEQAAHRVAWYHHADCILHSTSDFIALPFAPFRKGRRVPFAALRIVTPLLPRPAPADQVAGKSALTSRVRNRREGVIRVCTDPLNTPLTNYVVASPGFQQQKVVCDDVLVLERALYFNAAVEEEWKKQQELKGPRS